MKNSLKILAICLIMCLCVPFISCIVEEADEYAYVAIDINPSVELIIKNGKLVGVNAINEDASILLSGEDFKGLTVDEATEKIVALAEELGYLNEDNQEVNITVTADNEEIEKAIGEAVEKATEKASEIACVVREAKNEVVEEVKKLQEENPELYEKLTPAMHRIITHILALNPDLTYEELLEMKVSELIELLDSLNNKKDEGLTEEIKEEIKNHYKGLKDEAKKKIEELYKNAHQDREEIKAELEALYEEIKATAEENRELTEEELSRIKEIVGEKFEGVSIDDFNAFIEELNKKLEEKCPLTPEQKEERDKIKEEMKDAFKDAKEEFKNRFDECKDYFDDWYNKHNFEDWYNKHHNKNDKNDDIDENEPSDEVNGDESEELPNDENVDESVDNSEASKPEEKPNDDIKKDNNNDKNNYMDPIRDFFDWFKPKK